MAIVVLDASTVIAFLDANDRHHRAAGEAISSNRAEQLVLPVSAYAETLVGAYRHGGDAATRIDTALSDLAVRVEPLTVEMARLAARLRARYPNLRLPDALVLATADVLDAARVLTADRAWSRVSRRVQAL